VKLPRNIGGEKLCQLLETYDYKIIRQTGSHIRLTSAIKGEEHHITIPRHSPIKIGTLNQIISTVAIYLGMDKKDLIENLFS
jgi:predicted RNA binding protein YcfA (HicA-like mRNA interferase family)